MGNRGFTLIELLMVLLAASFILIGLSRFFVDSEGVAASSQSQAFLQRQGALAMDEITRRIRSASALDRGLCNADVNSIRVTNTNLPPNTGPYCIYRTGNQLRMDDNVGGTWNLLSGTVARLTVTNFTTTLVGPTVNISFQLSDNRGNAMTFQTNVTRRN